MDGAFFDFSMKPVTLSCSSTDRTPNRDRFVQGNLDRRKRDRRAAFLVEAQHPGVIHFVDVIARQHDHVVRVFLHDRIEVLVDRVGRALVPVFADALLRGKNFDEFAELLGDDAPAHPDVTIQRERFVLRGNEDAAQPGIEAIAQREIDDSVRTAEKDRWFRAISGEGIQPFAGAPGKENDQRVVDHGLKPLIRKGPDATRLT